MISDEVFIKELDSILKKQGYKKKADRDALITYALRDFSIYQRDAFLESELKKIPKKEQIPTEETEQINFVEWFRKTYPGVVILAIWNGGSRTKQEKAKQIAMGVHPGAADLFVPAWGLWVEMKRTNGWKLSEEQEVFAKYAGIIGQSYILGIGFESAKYQVSEFINRKRENN